MQRPTTMRSVLANRLPTLAGASIVLAVLGWASFEALLALALHNGLTAPVSRSHAAAVRSKMDATAQV